MERETGDTTMDGSTETTTAAGDEPPACVRWDDDGETGILELEVTRPFVEWLEMDAADTGLGDHVGEYAVALLWRALQQDMEDRHGPEVDVEIDVSDAFARRVGLWHKHREADGKPSEPADLAYNHARLDYSWTLDGEPWPLVEDDDADGVDDGGQ